MYTQLPCSQLTPMKALTLASLYTRLVQWLHETPDVGFTPRLLQARRQRERERLKENVHQ